jgi:hypothetical protein
MNAEDDTPFIAHSSGKDEPRRITVNGDVVNVLNADCCTK